MILEKVVLETEEEIQLMRDNISTGEPFLMFGKKYVVIKLTMASMPHIHGQSTCTLREVRLPS